MRRRSLVYGVPIVGIAILASAVRVRAGDLNPPVGPIAPTHKTLTEVEPRIAVNAVNTPGNAISLYRISVSGSYYLTGNITGVSGKHGIFIDAHDVTLDLNGFALIGVTDSLDGIIVPGARNNVVIRNGLIRLWGESGIESKANIGRIERITSSQNGAWGIDNGMAETLSAHVVSCETYGNGGLVSGSGGIRAWASAHIVNCVTVGNIGDGINAGSASTVSGCTSGFNNGDGIVVEDASAVFNCLSSYNLGDGIQALRKCRIFNNSCSVNTIGGGAGIHLIEDSTHVEGNVCINNAKGIDVDSAGNIIIRNTCTSNGTNWDIVAGNAVAPIVQASTNGAAIIGSNYAGGLGSTDPNANFTY